MRLRAGVRSYDYAASGGAARGHAVQGAPLMRIDVHSHLVPDVLFPVLAERGVSIMGLPPAPGQPIAMNPSQGGNFEVEQLYSVERRLLDMDKQRVDMHVLSVPPVFFYTKPLH